MKHIKVFVVAAILGLSLGLLPQAGYAGDVRVGVGFFLGLPVPVLTFDDYGPYHRHGYAYGPAYGDYYHHGYRHGYYGPRGYYGRGDYGPRGYGHRGHGRGDYGRGGHGHGHRGGHR